jgi:hypothetical protein
LGSEFFFRFKWATSLRVTFPVDTRKAEAGFEPFLKKSVDRSAFNPDNATDILLRRQNSSPS